MIDISKIILTEEEQRIFDRFPRSGKTTLTRAEFQTLLEKNLVENSMDGKSGWFGGLPDEGMCRLSSTGRDLKAYQRARQKSLAVSTRRYWITTAIAVAALIKAFLPEICAGLAALSTLLTR